MAERDDKERVKLSIHVEYTFDGEVTLPLRTAREIWEDRDSYGKTTVNLHDLFHLFEDSLDISDAEITETPEWATETDFDDDEEEEEQDEEDSDAVT